MNRNANRHEGLVKAIKSRVKARSLKYSDIAGKTGIHSSQVSRICRGHFHTRSENVVQICLFLGIEASDDLPDGSRYAQNDELMGLITQLTIQETDRLIEFLQGVRIVLEARGREEVEAR